MHAAGGARGLTAKSLDAAQRRLTTLDAVRSEHSRSSATPSPREGFADGPNSDEEVWLISYDSSARGGVSVRVSFTSVAGSGATKWP